MAVALADPGSDATPVSAMNDSDMKLSQDRERDNDRATVFSAHRVVRQS